MRHFYTPIIDQKATTYTLTSDESKHVVKVLRLKEGDEVALLDGKGSVYTAEITEASQKACTLRIKERNFTEPPAYEMHLVLAPTKNTERIEWLIEKATELGVSRITFISTKQSERTRTNFDRLERKIISAFKQSQRSYMPQLDTVIYSFEEFVKGHTNGLIAHCMDTPKESFTNVFRKLACPVLIGPEGDFTSDEVAFAQSNGYKAISLGKTRLRTETAALYACTLMKSFCE